MDGKNVKSSSGGDDQLSLYTELTQLVGGLAHEIKNPLSTINLNLKLLGEDLGRHHDEEHHRLVRRLDRVQDETERLRLILEDFLRYAGKYELNLRRTDLCELICELRDFFLPQAEAHRLVDAGHYVVEDAHERIVPLIEAFLEKHAS